MNLSNIISAGRMISIVVALLGAFNCGAAFALRHEGMVWNIVLGAAFIACGLVLMVLLRRVARYVDSATDTDSETAFSSPRPALLGTAILSVGTLVMLLGVVDVSLGWRDPFSWMTALVGIVIFIDVLCLRISLSRD